MWFGTLLYGECNSQPQATAILGDSKMPKPKGRLKKAKGKRFVIGKADTRFSFHEPHVVAEGRQKAHPIPGVKNHRSGAP